MALYKPNKGVNVCNKKNGKNFQMRSRGVKEGYFNRRVWESDAIYTFFCLVNNLIVVNTFYKHKDIRKYTRQMPSRNKKSIIDYSLVDKDKRKEALYATLKRGRK